MATDLAFQNPFAVLTIIGAPAILTNASSIMALTTSGRLNRCLDRIREISAQTGARPKSESLEEAERLRNQSRFFLTALKLVHVSMACFAISTLFSVLGAALIQVLEAGWIQSAAVLSMVIGGIGIFGIARASLLLVRATRLSMVNVESSVAAAVASIR